MYKCPMCVCEHWTLLFCGMFLSLHWINVFKMEYNSETCGRFVHQYHFHVYLRGFSIDNPTWQNTAKNLWIKSSASHASISLVWIHQLRWNGYDEFWCTFISVTFPHNPNIIVVFFSVADGDASFRKPASLFVNGYTLTGVASLLCGLNETGSHDLHQA